MKIIKTNESNLDIKVNDLSVRVTDIENLIGKGKGEGKSIDVRITSLESDITNINAEIVDIQNTEIDI